MNQKMRTDADAITKSSLKAVLPDEAVARALKTYESKGGKTILVAKISGIELPKCDEKKGVLMTPFFTP